MSRRKEAEEFKKKLIPVGTKIPKSLVKIIEKRIIPQEFVSMSDYIRHLIREDLKRRRLIV